MTPLSLVGYGFAAAVTWSCVSHMRYGGLKEDWSVFRGRNLRDWAEVVVGNLLGLGTIFGAYALAAHGPAFLQWSWLSLLATKGEAAQGSNQMLAGATIPFFGIFFVGLLILNLPRLAAAEEDMFRQGTRDWLHAIPRSLGFGLMHMIVGVPLWCGLALSIPGLWFTRQYFKGGVGRSTFAHTVYNLLAASLVLTVVIQSTLSLTSQR